MAHAVILMDLLTTCQVTQIQLASHEHAARIWAVPLDQQLEDGVGARRVNVGARLSRDTARLTAL